MTPAQWDTLPLLGVGATAQVRAAGAWVVKVAHPSPEARARLRAEARLHRRLAEAGLPMPRLRAVLAGGRALVRERLPGPPLGARLPGARVRRDAFALWLRVCAVEQALGVRLDFSPSNLYLRRGRVVLGDAGVRAAAPVFRARTLAGFVAEWRRWLSAPRPARAQVREPLLPPSGRFHVDVPVGPVPGARVLWVNRPLLGRLGLGWNDAFVRALGNLSTRARRKTTTRPATRYADMLALDLRRGPKGDGRCVWLGDVDTALGPRQLTLKGCGPTPLAWKERRFHFDGWVSFPRALWEVSIGDELARLGFDAVQAVALVENGATTRDNTGRRWPAVTAVRVAATHYRLGHLRRLVHRPVERKALLAHVPGFSPDAFASNLGSDVGRADALQVHGFNPTPGNVRLDGHLIDFSTVRVFRDHLPDFRILEQRFTVRQTRGLWLRMVWMLADVLRLGAAARRRLAARYRRAYARGFAEGFALLGGFAPRRFGARLVEATRALRELRGAGQVRLRFWKQTCAAPLFDVIGALPRLQRALARGVAEPWRALLRRPGSVVSPADERRARRWVAQVAPLLRTARPKAWAEVLRPGVEAEVLARLCYGRSRPASFAAWQRWISTSSHLPPGRYGYARARAWAERLGHAELPRVDGGGSERVVGLTPELLKAARAVLRRTLGPSLVGAVAHGSRVVERRELRRRDPRAFAANDLAVRGREGVREAGPTPGASSDLDLKVFVRARAATPAKARAVGEALARLGAWFPFSARTPPVVRLIATRAPDVRAAFRAWNGAGRKRAQGKGPIPAAQAVVLVD